MPDTISSTKQERPYILLVAEENALRRSLQLTLRARGYEVRAFASGAHALAEPSALQATCLITDHHRSEEHTSELQSLMRISYAVFCLKKKKITKPNKKINKKYRY